MNVLIVDITAGVLPEKEDRGIALCAKGVTSRGSRKRMEPVRGVWLKAAEGTVEYKTRKGGKKLGFVNKPVRTMGSNEPTK